jgi:hypothetical protein
LSDVRFGIGERTFAVSDWIGLCSRLLGLFLVGSVATASLGGKSSNDNGLEMVPDFESASESRGLTDADLDSSFEGDVDSVFDDVDLSFAFGSREMDFESAGLGRDSGFVDFDPLAVLTRRGSLGFALLLARSAGAVTAMTFGAPIIFDLDDSGFDAALSFAVVSTITVGVLILSGGLSVVDLKADLLSGVVDFGLLSGVVDFNLLSDTVDFGLLSGVFSLGLSSGGVNFCRLFSGVADLDLDSSMLDFELVIGFALTETKECVDLVDACLTNFFGASTALALLLRAPRSPACCCCCGNSDNPSAFLTMTNFFFALTGATAAVAELSLLMIVPDLVGNFPVASGCVLTLFFAAAIDEDMSVPATALECTLFAVAAMPLA